MFHHQKRLTHLGMPVVDLMHERVAWGGRCREIVIHLYAFATAIKGNRKLTAVLLSLPRENYR